MNRLELLIPPPAVMVVTGIIMWLLARSFPALSLPWPRSILAGTVIILLGLAISLAGVITFRRANTTTDPRLPAETSTLVTSGIYLYSRNPMYLGVLLILIGWAVSLGNVLSVLCAAVFVAYITRYQILPEERALQDKFGSSFMAYKGQVRRWL